MADEGSDRRGRWTRGTVVALGKSRGRKVRGLWEKGLGHSGRDAAEGEAGTTDWKGLVGTVGVSGRSVGISRFSIGEKKATADLTVRPALQVSKPPTKHVWGGGAASG